MLYSDDEVPQVMQFFLEYQKRLKIIPTEPPKPRYGYRIDVNGDCFEMYPNVMNNTFRNLLGCDDLDYGYATYGVTKTPVVLWSADHGYLPKNNVVETLFKDSLTHYNPRGPVFVVLDNDMESSKPDR